MQQSKLESWWHNEQVGSRKAFSMSPDNIGVQEAFDQHRCIELVWSSGRPTKLTDEVLQVIETALQANDETIARDLSVRLQQLYISKPYVTCRILKGWKLLGWTFHRSVYCQLIHAAFGVGQMIFVWWFWKCTWGLISFNAMTPSTSHTMSMHSL